MKLRLGLLTALFLIAGLTFLWPQDVRLPSGKSQTEEILKAEHKKSLRDVAEILKLAEELKAELEQEQHHVLSISTLKKVEEIEKRAKDIKSRLRRN
jgi:hypothetical protein